MCFNNGNPVSGAWAQQLVLVRICGEQMAIAFLFTRKKRSKSREIKPGLHGRTFSLSAYLTHEVLHVKLNKAPLS
jgi:hypothetical protein